MHSPKITVIHDRANVPGMARDSRVEAATLDAALAREWPFDAHFAAYEPIELAVDDGTTALVRARMHPARAGANADRTVYNTDGAEMRMRLLVGDVDAPDHSASDDWRAEVEPRLSDSGAQWYRTRGGYRLLAELDEPFIVDTPAAAAEWRARYIAWCDELSAKGLELDRSCADPTRVYRLPCVVRDGTVERAEIVGQRPRVALPAPAAPVEAPPAKPSAPVARPSAAKQAGMGAIIAALGDWRDWAGRKHDLVGAIGGLLRKALWSRDECTTLIRWWLDGAAAEGVNVEHGVDWACRAWDRDPAEVSGRAALDAIVGRDVGNAIEQGAMIPHMRVGVESRVTPAHVGDEPPDGWRVCRFSEAEVPIDYRCRDLCLATSKGKISVIAGQPGAGKGPIANHLAICLATGRPAFGFAQCQAAPTLLLDWEGTRLTMRRLRRMARALDIDPLELDGKLTVIDASGFTDPLAAAWQIELEHRIARGGIRHVIVDSYTSAMLATGVESNSTSFAELARLLGRLDVLVLAVAHANKASASAAKPRLVDVMGTGALGALAQTAIIVHRPDDEDEHRVRLSCARGPEGRFEPFDARFADIDSDRLAVARVEVEETPDSQPIELKSVDHDAAVRIAGSRILRAATAESREFGFTELARLCGETNTIARRALARLTDAGLIAHGSGHYWSTEAGRGADEAAAARALGLAPGGFQR